MPLIISKVKDDFEFINQSMFKRLPTPPTVLTSSSSSLTREDGDLNPAKNHILYFAFILKKHLNFNTRIIII